MLNSQSTQHREYILLGNIEYNNNSDMLKMKCNKQQGTKARMSVKLELKRLTHTERLTQ